MLNKTKGLSLVLIPAFLVAVGVFLIFFFRDPECGAGFTGIGQAHQVVFLGPPGYGDNPNVDQKIKVTVINCEAPYPKFNGADVTKFQIIGGVVNDGRVKFSPMFRNSVSPYDFLDVVLDKENCCSGK